MINELDVVALAKDLPDDALSRGDIGTVVHVHGKGDAFEVEFVALDGETIAILTLPFDAIRALDYFGDAHKKYADLPPYDGEFYS